jgi:hypothetical protein
MASTFKGLGLFNSGPHRFALGPQGEYVLINARLTPTQAGSTPIGPLELTVIVKGRLVAAGESALWTLRDAVTAQLTDPVQTGTLIDHHGRTWTDMSFVRYEEGDRTDRAREWSIGYTATFVRFLP